MESWQLKVVFALMVLVVFSWLISPTVGGVPVAVWQLPQIPYAFDPVRAYETTRDLVTQFPRRVLGSIESRQSTGFLRRQFASLGYAISYMHFDAAIDGRRQVGRNVLAFKGGRSPDIIAVLAHYDTARTTYQGATDDGSGIGVLLELARVFATADTRRSLLFVATDGEEWGMLGARDLAGNYAERSRVVAAVSLDSVCIDGLADVRLDTVGQMRGYTPPWLREISRRAGLDQSLSVSEPYGFLEHLERALLLSSTDQGPLLAAGIPAINLGSDSADAAREAAVYHSPQDRIENLDVASFDKYGRVAEKIVGTLDELPLIPSESMGIFRAKGLIFLSPRSILVLHYLTFLPLLAAWLFHWLNSRKYASGQRVLRELLAFTGCLLPCLAVFYGIYLLRLTRVIPGYTLYPATPKDPVLEHPSPGVLTGLAVTGLVVALLCYFVLKFSFRNMQRQDFLVAKSVLLTLLLVDAGAALLYNAYWAVTFLALPVWVWLLVGAGKGPGGRAANRIWILAAGIPCLMIQIHFASRLFLGWRIVWYEIIALSTGMFTFTAYLLAAGAICLGIRFLVIQSEGRIH